MLITTVHHQFIIFKHPIPQENDLLNWKHVLIALAGLFLRVDRKVFSKLSLHVPEKTVKKIVLNTAGAIEPALHVLKEKLQKKLEHEGDHTTVRPPGHSHHHSLSIESFLLL